jgi:hypothetical protein
MKRFRMMKWLLPAFAAGLALSSQPVFACAACYGKSDSPLAAAMNWGIFSLLGVVVSVLSCFGVFGVYLARRSARVAAKNGIPGESLPAPAQEA